MLSARNLHLYHFHLYIKLVSKAPKCVSLAISPGSVCLLCLLLAIGIRGRVRQVCFTRGIRLSIGALAQVLLKVLSIDNNIYACIGSSILSTLSFHELSDCLLSQRFIKIAVELTHEKKSLKKSVNKYSQRLNVFLDYK